MANKKQADKTRLQIAIDTITITKFRKRFCMKKGDLSNSIEIALKEKLKR